jgi:hypothetical protein
MARCNYRERDFRAGIGMTPAELRDIMKACGWTHQDLARLLPLRNPRCTRTIRYWLAGERKIHPVFAARIRSLAAESAA